jgi:hypothetical protein
MTPSNECAHFIPLVTDELVRLCCSDLDPAEGELLRALAVAVQDAHHSRYHRRQTDLKTAYAAFDPDGDALAVMPLHAVERQHRLNDVRSELSWLLTRAHYRHLSGTAFDDVLAEASEWGIRMQVDFSVFSHLAVFVRGDDFERRTWTNWRTWFQPRQIDVPIFRRLVLAFQLRTGASLGPTICPDRVYLKLFKDIPRADVDMLLPGARVRLNLLDRGKLGVGVLTGLGTMSYRVLTQMADFFHVLMEPGLIIWSLTAGVVSYAYKSYFDYQTTQQRYHLSLTQSLYFQNLDSNVGVLTRLFDEAEEQETRTAILGYFCLLRHAGESGVNADSLESAMGMYLDRYAGVPLMCQPGIVIDLLDRLGLIRRRDGSLFPVPLEEAVEAVKCSTIGGRITHRGDPV